MNKSSRIAIPMIAVGVLVTFMPVVAHAGSDYVFSRFMHGVPQVLGHFLLPALAAAAVGVIYKLTGKSDGSDLPALSREAARGNLARVMDLIEAGANINDSNKKGTTALMLAARNDRLAICEYLLERGADVKAATTKGKTALDIARKHASPPVVDAIKNAAAVKMIE